MAFFGIFFGILCVIGIIAMTIWKSKHKSGLAQLRVRAANKGYSPEEIEAAVEAETFPVPGFVGKSLIAGAVLFFGLGTFNNLFFYAEPGYVYHVRTLFPAQERVVNGVGYSYYGAGFYNSWKKAMTVQASAVNRGSSDALSAEHEGGANTSASLPPMNIMFLDQVDANAFATARFRIPTDAETFLKMAHEYRTPDNLLRTALVPAFKETLNATGSLMSAEEYYAGGRTEFNNEFEVQMQDGIYLVKRKEVRVTDEVANAKASANAAKGGKQEDFGNATKVVFKVEKLYAKDGATPLRKEQKFLDYGIQVVEARVTDMKPNAKFVDRMQLKQKASADRAIAREQRIQEEEQKLLAVAKGDREVAEKQAEAKVKQISLTTDAETTKQLAVTKANQQKEQATIEKETSLIRLAQARIDAKKIKTLADAEAYKKKAIIVADNALQQKLDAEMKIQQVWAEAYAKRAVPQYVIGGSSDGGTPVGGDTETSRFMQLMTIDAAKRLSYDRSLQPAK
jgi:regulator of protease activity HflC (stomatin/prohibitin superfamily)